MKSELSAIKRLCNSKAKVSSHYFIKYNGTIINLVPDLYEAWHAGISKWKKYNSLNKYSLGIELSNPGYKHGYKKFPLKQINSLKNLIRKLRRIYKIKTENILGHSDISPNRKNDPGEKFPWETLSKEKLSISHNLDKKKLAKYRKVNISEIEKKNFMRNCYLLGYVKIDKVASKNNIKFISKAFQRRFRQDLIDGKIDKECYLISKNLLN